MTSASINFRSLRARFLVLKQLSFVLLLFVIVLNRVYSFCDTLTMPKCAVAVCENYNQKTKGSSISYHKFPKDPETCARWVQLCRSDSINIKNATICSVHFKEDDYLRDPQAELMKLPPKKILKRTAVPSLHLIKATSAAAAAASSSVQERNDRRKDRETRKRALNRLASLSPKKKKWIKAQKLKKAASRMK
ncbi:THAP domain-containing protein 2-like [Schistocerca nitens]|uniref:THAP domain-containing protein 2-like n=1 Tax=Schistocerca nitens TaxID=7011 RepID=UPI0021189586|nr:THAP domain-containing protein 2-like [Schistocerca nitens]